jgi:hypothetical protein
MNTVIVLIIVNMLGQTTYNVYHTKSETECETQLAQLKVKEKVLFKGCVAEGELY